MRRLSRWLVAGAAAVAVAAIAPVAPASADDRPDIVVAVQSLPPTMEPTRELSNVGIRVMKNAFDKLVEYDYNANMKMVGGLATSWRYLDETTLELTLREGVTFHNGDEMTAEDVAFTFGAERMINEDAPAHGATRNYYGKVVSVEATGPYTVVFKTSGPDPFLIKKLGVWSGEVINKRAYLEAGDWDAWSRAPIGTGPYRIKEIRQNDRIVLEAFDDYYLGKPFAKTLTFRAVPEVSARIAGLASGEFDVITDVPPDQLGNIERYDDLEVAGGPIFNFRVLIFNQSQPIMKDVHLRRALALAIDRQLIVDSIWDGRTIVPEGHQWPEFAELMVEGYKPGYAHDLAAAKAELAKSSYKGEELVYPIVNNYYTNEVATAEILVEMWKAAGINVRMEVKENWKQVVDTPPFIRNWSNSMPFPDPVAGLWRLWQPSYVERRGWEWNPAGWAEAGAILDSGAPAAERKAAWNKMLDIWSFENPGGTMLHQNAIFYGKRKSLPWRAYKAQYMDFGPRNMQLVN